LVSAGKVETAVVRKAEEAVAGAVEVGDRVHEVEQLGAGLGVEVDEPHAHPRVAALVGSQRVPHHLAAQLQRADPFRGRAPVSEVLQAYPLSYPTLQAFAT
jgi:hypothetical protein